jgi:hypothetical protein
MAATGPFDQRPGQDIRAIDDQFSDEQYFEFMFPSNRLIAQQTESSHYDQAPAPAAYDYQSQPDYRPDQIWDMSSMHDAQPYIAPHAPAPTYHNSETSSQIATPAYYPSSPDGYQASPPPNTISSTALPSSIPPPPMTEPAIRHSEWSSVYSQRVHHVNIPLDRRTVDT